MTLLSTRRSALLVGPAGETGNPGPPGQSGTITGLVSGSLNVGTVTQPMTTLPVTLSALQSAANLVIVTGTISGTPVLTIAVAPTAGLFKIVRNNGTGSISVGWSTGTPVTIASSTAAVIGSDGTNAVVYLKGT